MPAVAGALALALTAGAALPSSAAAGGSRTLCVGGARGCYPTLQAALDRSHDGDTIQVGRGTFAGGVTVRTSVRIAGTGAWSTILRGGGPVITIGVPDAARQPVVSISGLTVTGGVAHGDGVRALGGGLHIVSASDPAGIAHVTIEDAVITRNRAEPTQTSPSPSGAPCPGGDCPFALALGGGIASFGDLTLRRVVVSDNEAAGIASDAVGAGIASSDGTLVLRDSILSGNRAIAGLPNGRFAEGGGVYVPSGALRITNTVVRGNSTELTSTLPHYLADGGTTDLQSHGGGVHVGTDVPAVIVRAAIVGNASTVHNPEGQGLAFASGLHVLTAPFELRDSIVSGNRVEAEVGDTEDVGFLGTALELDGGGTVTGSRVTDNTVRVHSAAGVAAATSGLAVYSFADDPQPATVRDSVIARNTADASSETGSATVQGAGVVNNAMLALDGVRISDNVGTATGPAGFLQGGGIWNGVLLSGPPVELTVRDSLVTGNALRGAPGLAVAGGGLFTTEPVTLTRTRTVRNEPDQCSGC
jgi:hypothetical protein